MEITWDPAKARVNYARHEVRFSDAEPVFYDSNALTIEDASSSGEQRFVTIGATGSADYWLLFTHIEEKTPSA